MKLFNQNWYVSQLITPKTTKTLRALIKIRRTFEMLPLLVKKNISGSVINNGNGYDNGLIIFTNNCQKLAPGGSEHHTEPDQLNKCIYKT